MPKKKIHRKAHHVRKTTPIGLRKNKIWRSSWTFSIIGIGLSVFALAVVITFKQTTEVLGTATNNNVACYTQRVCACAVDTFCLFCKNQTICTPLNNPNQMPVSPTPIR